MTRCSSPRSRPPSLDPLPAPPGSGERVRFWQVPAVVKVFPDDDPPRRITPARIAVARNEREPLQLAVPEPDREKERSPGGRSPCRAGGSPAGQLETGVVGYVPVDHATGYYQSKSPAVAPESSPTAPGNRTAGQGSGPTRSCRSESLRPRAGRDPAYLDHRSGRQRRPGRRLPRQREAGRERGDDRDLCRSRSTSGTSPCRSSRTSRRSMTSVLAQGEKPSGRRATDRAYPADCPRDGGAGERARTGSSPIPPFRYENGRASGGLHRIRQGSPGLLRRLEVPSCLHA